MKTQNRELGSLAETLASNALVKKGYKIIERNFSNRFGEIDIIAKHRDVLVFVEVKAKKGTSFGHPWEMVNAEKLKKIQRMATVYLKGKNLPCRIDVVSIVFSSENKIESLAHYENVYF